MPLIGGNLGIDRLGALLLGGFAPGADEIDDRVLVQMLDGGDFRALVFVLAETVLRRVETVRSILPAYDPATAQGAQQDALGALIDLPRRGYPDGRYRTFLAMQSALLLAPRRTDARWTGTIDNLLLIVRTFIGGTPGDGRIRIFSTAPPYSYILDIEGVDIAELGLLARFLCLASYAGVLGNVYFKLAENSIWNSDTAGSTIPDTGFYGSDHAGSAIADVATWGTHVAIGGEGRAC